VSSEDTGGKFRRETTAYPIPVAAAVMLVAVPAVQVDAWGNTGHRLIGVAAMRALSDDLPAFLRTPASIADVGELAREPDRWKGAGQPHDRERDTAHFIDFDDNGFAMKANGPSIDALPRLKSDFDTLMDAYQNLGRDFAYWRVLTAAEGREMDPGKKAWYRADRERREALILRDIGVLAHYVGDGSQPHHLSIHFNGWGDYPNPEGFTNSRRTHGIFEGEFASRVARLDTVEAAMSQPQVASLDLRARTAGYLKTTLGTVIPFYRLEKAGGFKDADPRGAAFVNERLAAGASELRDLIILNWRESGTASIGWPAVKVAEVEAGTVDPWLSMIGED
jgi:hypothetical protein